MNTVPLWTGTGKSTTNQNRAMQLIDLYGDVCAYCDVALNDFTRTIDHWMPQSFGGSNKIHNLLLACVRCNHIKGQIPGPAWDLMLKRGLLQAIEDFSPARRALLEGKIGREPELPKPPKRRVKGPQLEIVKHDDGFAAIRERDAQVEGGGPRYIITDEWAKKAHDEKQEWKSRKRRQQARDADINDPKVQGR